MGSQPTRTAFRSPWQNGVPERWKLPTRSPRTRDRPQRTASEAAHGRIRLLLPRGPDAPRARQGHASRSANSNPLRGWKRDSILAETRRPAPSLCSSGVDSRIILPTTKLFPFYQSGGAAFCPSTLSGSNSRPPPISLLSRPKALRQVERSRCNVARATFWRTTGPAGAACVPSTSSGCFIDSSLSTGTKSGYTFTLAIGSSPAVGGIAPSYSILARPVTPNQTGTRYFCSFEDAVVRSSTGALVNPCVATTPALQ